MGAPGAPLPVPTLPIGSYCGNGIIDQGPRNVTVSTPLGSPWVCTPNYNSTTGSTPATIRDYTCAINLTETCDAGS